MSKLKEWGSYLWQEVPERRINVWMLNLFVVMAIFDLVMRAFK